MITIYARGVVKEDKIEEYKEIATQMMNETRKEKGCINYTLFQDMNDPQVFCFIEHWENQECIDAHNSSAHFMELVPKMRELRLESSINFYKEV